VEIDHRGIVVGVVERPNGRPLPKPEPLSEQQIQAMREVYGLIEITAEQARCLTLHQRNERRRADFEARVGEAVRIARTRLGRWPTIREVQAVLVARRLPAGRKEKVGKMIARVRAQFEGAPSARGPCP